MWNETRCNTRGVASAETTAVALGFVASSLYAISLLPQLRLLLLGKYDTTAVSASMFVVQLASGVLWLAYGVMKEDVPVWMFAIVSTTMRLWILCCLVKDRCNR